MSGHPVVPAQVRPEAETGARHAQLVESWKEDWPATLPQLNAAERARLAGEYRQRIVALQASLGGAGRGVARPLHRKGVFAAAGTFRVRGDLHPALRFGALAEPGASHDARVRFSNAAGRAGPDSAPDLRGLAVRLTDGSRVQDLLATNYPTSHARDTADFMAAANLARGVRGLPALLARMPPWQAFAMIRFLKGTLAPSASLADETYYARSHYQLGAKLVEFRWVPAHEPGVERAGRGERALTDELVARVRAGALRFALELRGWIDETATPTGDGRRGWTGDWTTAGTLEIPASPSLSDAAVERALAAADADCFSIANRWDADPRALRGRGLLNEFREEVYAASQAARR